MDIYTLIVAGHAIGAILGTGGATIAELQIRRALRDGKVGRDERALLHTNYWMIRAGLAFIILSSLAMVWYHLGEGNAWILTSEKLWAKDIMVVVIIANAIALSRRLVPLHLGAAVSLVSWWSATLLGLLGRLPYSFSTYLLVYLLAILAVFALMRIRPVIRPKQR